MKKSVVNTTPAGVLLIFSLVSLSYIGIHPACVPLPDRTRLIRRVTTKSHSLEVSL